MRRDITKNYEELIIKKVDESLKKRIVEEIESGEISQNEASRTYGFSRVAIGKWMQQYGKLRCRTRIVEVTMRDESKKIAELQKALAESHLKVRFYEHIIDCANEEYKTDLKKNFDTRASEDLRLKDGKSKVQSK